MALFRRSRVVKHCPENHVMEKLWTTCPRCSGRPAERVRTDFAFETVVESAPRAARPAAGPAPARPVVWTLTGAGDATPGPPLRLTAANYRFGKAPKPGEGVELITMADPFVSRNHAQITVTPEGLRLRDLGSANGTFVNEQRVDDVRLSEGDEVRLGKSTFRVGIARS